jgi:phosphoglycolate phosphatase
VTLVRLVLFDIDGTIIGSDGAGYRAMTGALTEIFGGPGPDTYRYDGKTDPQIVREQMRNIGHSDDHIDANMDELKTRYLAGLRRELDGGARVRVHPGIGALLDRLEAREDIIVGLLTGNLAEGADAKLRAAGLDPSRFRVNAFGSDHHHRPELPAIAQRRARDLLGLDIHGDRIFVIGDTPADIECAQSIGAKTIAVATGRYTVDDLARHNPTAVFANLGDTEAVLRVILG